VQDGVTKNIPDGLYGSGNPARILEKEETKAFI